MWRTVILYALGLALAAAAVEWLNHRYLLRGLSGEVYIGLLAAGFVALGLWAGHRLTAAPPPRQFQRNDAAIASLGLSPRECEILELLASGQSNKQMARSLGISPNTVKTHIARVYEKLEVRKRMQAVDKARWLSLIP